MSLFDGVDVVFYQVCSMDRAVEFYSGVLGLELIRREGNDWTELRAGDTVIALSGELATRPHQGGATVTNEDFTAMTLDSPEALAAAEFYIGLVNDGFAAQRPVLGIRHTAPGEKRRLPLAAVAANRIAHHVGTF